MAYSKEDGRYRPTKTVTVPKVTVSANSISTNEGRYRPTTTTTVPKVTVATSTMPKITVSSNSVNTDEGRYRPTATPAMPKVTISYNAANSNAKSPSFWERTKDTVLDGAGKSTASDINMAANLYDLTQGARDTMMGEYLSAYEDGLRQAQRDLEQLREDGARARDIADQQAIVDDFQLKYNAMSAAGDAQRGATKATYGLADDVQSSAEKRIDHAKDGLGTLGQVLVDAGANWTQTGLDAVKNGVFFGGSSVLPLIGRKYGERTQTARQAGADVGRASLYGTAGAGVDAIIEQLFDGLNGIYGEREVDPAEAFRSLKTDSQFQRFIKSARNDAGEGLESAAADAANQILKHIYGEKAVQNLSMTEIGRVVRDIVSNTIVGIFSGDTMFELSR